MREVDAVIRQSLASAQRILIVSHVRPDGDAVGSLLGLGLALIEAGKDVQMVLADGVPASFRKLPGSQLVKHRLDGAVDLRIVVDCADRARVGGALQDHETPDINIDHHVTNSGYGAVNLIEPDSVATCAVLTAHLAAWDLRISANVASALLNGIISDTIGFRTHNTTSAALRQAADLVDAGANLSGIYADALINRSFPAVKYWGCGLQKFQREDRLAWTDLTLEDRAAAGYRGNDDADLVNVLSAVEDIDIALIFVEQKGGIIKISWRCVPGLDVSQIALSFGGGGHPAAAGANIPGTMAEVQEKVLNATRLLLSNNHRQVEVTQELTIHQESKVGS